MKLSEAIEFTDTHRWEGTSSRHTVLINANHLLRVLGDIEIEDVKTKHFTQLLEWAKSEGYAPSTQNKVTGTLATIMKELISHGHELTVPGYKKAKIKKNARPDFYTEEEMEKILMVAGTRDDFLLLHDCIMFAFKTGCRKGELLQLTWDCLDWKNNEILFRDTKNGEDHYLPIPKDLQEILDRRLEQAIDERVFAIPCNTYKQQGDFLLDSIKAICKQLGVKERLWHTIRHTTATHLCSKGVPIRVVMNVLNHKSVNTTLRYAKVFDSSTKEALDLI